MSDKIDQRIVEMSFENDKFEKGILQSKNSLSEFNNALKNTSKEDFSGLERSVKEMGRSFNAFQEIAVGALRKIGSEVISVGANVFKSLAIAPITQGFTEMELKMNATQTIMASTGETLATVNGYLQELNEYSDKTIYSFSDMTQNIGKFTNAGVKLEMAVASIKGISNAAALAGANSQEASRAMYNFAQALSSGYVKLIDWKSIELANMATVEFKQQLLDAAAAAGTVKKSANGMYKVLTTDGAGKTMEQAISATRNFNDSLSFQWMTTDALTKTLAAYSDETTEIGKRASKAATQVTTFSKLMETLKESVGSGWSQTFELIFGDFNEARDLWTGLNTVLGGMIGTISDARNNLLSGGLGSGWKQFMQEGISDATAFGDALAVVAGEAGIDIDNIAKKAGSMEKAVKGNWLTGDMLIKTISKMSASIEGLSEKELRNAGYTEKTRKELLELRDALKSGKISADEFAAKMGAMSGRENIIQGLKNSVIALLKALKPISQAFDQIFPPMTVKRLYEMTEAFKNFTSRLIVSEETADKIRRTFAGLFAIIDIGVQGAKFLANAFFEVVKAFFPIGDGALSATASLGDFLVMINQFIKSSGAFQYGLLGVKIAMTLVHNLLSKTVEKVSEFVHGLLTAENPLEYLKTAGQKAFGGILDTVKMVVTWVSNKFTKAVNGAQRLIDSKIGKDSTGIFSEILEIIKSIVGFVSVNAVEGFRSLGDTLKNLDFAKIATFVTGGILLIFVRQISDLTGALTGLTKTAASTLDQFSKKFLGSKTSTRIRDIAYTIGVLAASIWVLSKIPADELKKSLLGLTGAIVIFVGAFAAIEAIKVASAKAMKDKEVVASAFNLVGLAAALAIMATALRTIGKIDKLTVWDAVSVLGAMLGFIVVYQALSALISKIPGQNKVTLNLFGISVAIMGVVGALALLNAFPIGGLQSALSKMSVILVALAFIQQLFGIAARIGGGNKAAVSFLGLAAGIVAMVGVLKLLSIIDPATISSGIANMARIVLLMAGIEIVLGLAARIGGGNKLQNNVLSTQLGMLAMVGLIALLSLIKQEDINRGLFALAAMGGIIGAIEIMTAGAARLAGGAKVQKILGSVTITMLAFTGIIALLGAMDPSAVDRGMLAITKIAGLIVAIELLTALSARVGTLVQDGKVIGSAKSFASLLGVVTAVITLTGALALLSMGDQEALRQSSVSLAIAASAVVALSAAVSLMMRAMNSMSKETKSIGGALKNLIPAFVALGTIIVASMGFFYAIKPVLQIIEDTSFESLAKFILAMGFVTSLIAALNQIKFNGDPKKMLNMLPAFVAITGVVVATMGFFEAIKLVLATVDGISWDNLAKFTLGLAVVSGLLAGMAALAVPLSIVGYMPQSFLIGVASTIGGLGLVIGAFVLVSELMSGLNAEKLTKGMDTLVSVGSGIGRFIGAFVGGIAMETLTGIAEGLSSFAKAFSGIPADSFDGIKALASAMLAITGAAVVDGLSRFITLGKSPTEVFGEQLKGLIASIKDISVKDANSASAVLAAMKPMAENLTAMANAAKNIPNSGGFVGAFLGNNDPDDFGIMLTKFVNAFTATTPSLATHACDVLAAMTPMIDNLKAFANAAQGIPNSGGFMGAFLGNNDIDMFGTQLTNFINIFAANDAETATKAAGVLEAMKPMIGNLKKFADAASDIPSSGGFVGDFLGTVSLETFASQIHGLIGTFGGVNETTLNSAISTMRAMSVELLPALTSFSTLSNGLKNSGGLAQLFSGNTTLTEFGVEIANFVRTLSYVNFSVVEPTLKGLANVVKTFEDLGTDSLTNAKNAFEKNKEPFQAAIATIVDTPIDKLKSKKNDLSDTVGNTFSAVKKNSQSYTKDFKKLGGDIVDGLKNGINEKKPSAINAVTSLMSSVTFAARKTVQVNSPSKVFATIGGWCTKGLAVGIQNETNVAVAAGVNMAKATEEGIRDTLGVHSLSEEFAGIGEWVPKSLGTGVNKGKKWLVDQAHSLGIDTSTFTVEGLATGMTGGEGMITSGISSLLDQLTGSKTVSDAAGGTGKSIGNSMTNDMQKSLSNNTSGLGGSNTKSVVKSELDKIKSYIEEEKFYGRMGLEEELAQYEKLRLKYKNNSDERKQIDREIYTLMKSIYEAQLSYTTEVQDAEKDAADERLKTQQQYDKDREKATSDASEKLADLKKTYDKNVLSDKVNADKKVQSAEKSYYNDLNKILDQAEKDRQSTRKQYAANQKSINDKLLSDIEAQNKAYEDAVKSRADTIYSSYGLFSTVEPDTEVSGTDLLKNLRDQGAALSEWEQSLNALAGRGVGDKLIEELEKLGPSSKAQIKALLTLTDDQLNEYVSLYEGKYAFARKKSEIELEGLKDSTAKAIQDLNAQAAIDLGDLETKFKNSMTTIDSDMAIDLEKLRATHKEALDEIEFDLTEKLASMETEWRAASAEIEADLSEKLNEIETTYNDSLTQINSDLSKKLADLKSKFSSTMKDVDSLTTEQLRKLITENNTKLTQLNVDTGAKLVEVEKTFDKSGNTIVSNFGSDMKSLKTQTSDSLSNLNTEVRSSLADLVGDFLISGGNAAGGFAKGIYDGTYLAVDAAKFMASKAVEASKKTLNERSPSRVFAGIGQYVSMGFANGIMDYAYKAELASKEMANGPIAAVSKALAEIDGAMSDEFGWEPVITPILDLSNIKSGYWDKLIGTPVRLGDASGRFASDAVQNGSRDEKYPTSVVNNFNLSGLTVRSEDDIDLIATKLYQKQNTALRGRGVRANQGTRR